LRLGPLVPATALAAAVLLARCGGDDAPASSNLTPEQTLQIAGVAELATNAWAAAGPEALYDYLDPQVAARCSKQALVTALADQPLPDGFRRIENVQAESHVVRVTVVQLFGDTERGIEWQFWPVGVRPSGATPQKEDQLVWRIEYLPGLEKCGS
jgi:hypothetical protein